MNLDFQPNGRTVTRTGQIKAGRIVMTWLAIAILVISGCDRPAPKPRSSGRSVPRPGQNAHQDELADIAIDTLDRLEEFDGMEMLQQAVNRLDRWVTQQPPPDDWTPDPFVVKLREDLALCAAELRKCVLELAKLSQIEDLDATNSQLATISEQFKRVSRHSSDMADATYLVEFERFAERMDDWAEQLKALGSAAEGDTPRQTLDKVQAYVEQMGVSGLEFQALRLEEFARQIDVEDLAFPPATAFALQEVVWLRNISRWVVGEDRADPLRAAIRLFDWTVRNIQLDYQPSSPDGEALPVVLQYPWETLLLGHGSVQDRAWTFILLARQQRLDAVWLATVDQEDPDKRRLKPLGIGVLLDGEVHVFDPRLGVPIPGPDGVRLDGPELIVHPATLSQLAADDSLSRQMDLDAEHPFELQASDFQKVVVLMAMSPSYLTKRMKLVESRLTGEARLVLTTSPEEQAANFKSFPQVVEVRYWERPYQTILQTIELARERAEWKRAQLLPFYRGPNGISPLMKGRTYHFKGAFTGDPNAIMFYQGARRSQRELDAERHRNQREQANASDPRLPADMVTVIEIGKMTAGYWLGLIHAHQGNHRSAIDYFHKRTIVAFRGGPWTHGAIYNLARTFESQERFSEAIRWYGLDGDSPSREGNLIRAMWLEKLAKPEGKTRPEKDGDAETERTEKTP